MMAYKPTPMPAALPLLVLELEVVVCWGLAGGSLACFFFGGSVSYEILLVLRCAAWDPCASTWGYLLPFRRKMLVLYVRGWDTYAALESADEEALEDLAGLVAVADVFEGFGGVLAADVEEDFFTAGVLVYEAWRARGG